MPITPTLTVDPTVMTNNWAAGLQSPSNAQKLQYKYNHPKRVFNYDPPAQQTDWASGVAKAHTANKYATGMANADLNAASDNMVKYGVANWSNAGTSKRYKYARKSANLAAAINQVMAIVAAMPKGKGANNRARALAWFDNMSAFYGKI